MLTLKTLNFSKGTIETMRFATPNFVTDETTFEERVKNAYVANVGVALYERLESVRNSILNNLNLFSCNLANNSNT